MDMSMHANQRPIMVMAGGTGGHVFPALAVAIRLRDMDQKIIWMGTHAGIEADLVPAADFPIEWLTVQGLRGKGLLVKTLAPFKMLRACWQALSIMRCHRPRAVLGMGGVVAAPGGLMAWLLRIPLIIHEQNAVIGLTNKVLSPFSRINFFAFPQAAEGIGKSQVVGNPLRQEILSIEPPVTRLAGRYSEQLNLLVLGGSLGARALNQAVPDALHRFDKETMPIVRHQCGQKHVESCQQQYRKNDIEAQVMPFIEDMKGAYEWADLVICRSGALTVAELAAAGVASILVPYPYAVDDHQYFNAEFLSKAGAARLVREQDLTAPWLCRELLHLTKHRDELLKMACNARSIAYTDASDLVAQGILKEALI